MRARFSTTCVLFVGVLFAASVIAEVPYPENWPQVAKRTNGACSSIAGRYEYFGETARRPTPFSTIKFDNSGFNRTSIRGRPQTALVSHALGSSQVFVTIEGQELSPKERTRFAVQTKCEHGWLSYVREAPGSRAELRYALAADGSLIVHSLGMRAHKPLVGQLDTWRREWLYRFRKATSANER